MMNGDTNPVGTAAVVAGALVAVVNTGVATLSATGVVQWDTQTQVIVNSFIVALVNAGAIIIPLMLANRKVTPLAEPKAKDGEPLVRESGDVRSAAIDTSKTSTPTMPPTRG